MRGRKPKPTAIHLLNGNPSKIRLNADEPVPDTGDPQPPGQLSPEALAQWNIEAPRALALGVLTEADVNAFAAYCQTCADYWESIEMLRRFGKVVMVNVTKRDRAGKALNGTPAASPWVRMRKDSLARMQALAVEFGMTASSRSRVHATGQPKKNTAQKFQDSAPKLRMVK